MISNPNQESKYLLMPALNIICYSPRFTNRNSWAMEDVLIAKN